ncbi:MAG: efflux RND transporter periplasmic adaptor subunit [SAR324 cluster bacterium]|uniref:Efflux RND transporter periplasmic adaptor subunit n=1 Tax=SAR324 cluster bacterium TaxID=2024889 RepID=A0A7X9FPH1_9DELT|nr:efflux RND transporter periplasmic adaptor subunit [SAR324 cluster bacterium]
MKLSCNKKSKYFLALLIVSLCLSLASCGDKKTDNAGANIDVNTIKIQPEQLILTTELAGRISAFRTAEIRPQVSGIIQKRLFEEGSEVKEGDVLYQIEPAPFQAAFENAKAALAKAEARVPATQLRLSRYKDLLSDKAVSQQDYDDVDAAMKQALADVAFAKAAVESARINLDFTKITAPISGRIGRSNVTDGALVTAHQPMTLATIQQLDSVYADLPQPTSALLKLKRSLEEGKLNRGDNGLNNVKIILEDGVPYELPGVLQFRDVTVEPSTGSVILRVVVSNPKNVLLPGMFVRAIIQEGVNNNAIFIPQQTLSRDPKGNPYVLLVGPDSKVQLRMIQVDRAIGDRWLVSSGLNSGDQLILDNLQKLKPGMLVKAIQKDSSTPTTIPSKTN